MRKRTNKFIGGAEWRGRDVSIWRPIPSALAVKDNVSGIVVTGWIGQTEEQLLGELAHRVRQMERG